jgi:hypothetical protein
MQKGRLIETTDQEAFRSAFSDGVGQDDQATWVDRGKANFRLRSDVMAQRDKSAPQSAEETEVALHSTVHGLSR